MTRLASRFIPFITISVSIFAIPAGIGHIVEAMGAVCGQGQTTCLMTDRAFSDDSAVSLKRRSSHIIIGIRIIVGPDGMGTAVAPLAEDPAVTFTISIQSVIVFRET
jgi:hypothetical protein